MFSLRAGGVAQHADKLACAVERSLRQGVVQYARGDRVPLGAIGIRQALWRCPADHLGQLPAQIHRILNTGVEALPTDRDMHVCGCLTDHTAPFIAPDRISRRQRLAVGQHDVDTDPDLSTATQAAKAVAAS
jgi:hypothetical protein